MPTAGAGIGLWMGAEAATTAAAAMKQIMAILRMATTIVDTEGRTADIRRLSTAGDIRLLNMVADTRRLRMAGDIRLLNMVADIRRLRMVAEHPTEMTNRNTSNWLPRNQAARCALSGGAFELRRLVSAAVFWDGRGAPERLADSLARAHAQIPMSEQKHATALVC